MSGVLNEDELWSVHAEATRLRYEAETILERAGQVRREVARTEYAGRAADELRGRIGLRDRVVRSLAVDLQETSRAIPRVVAAAEEGLDR